MNWDNNINERIGRNMASDPGKEFTLVPELSVSPETEEHSYLVSVTVIVAPSESGSRVISISGSPLKSKGSPIAIDYGVRVYLSDVANHFKVFGDRLQDHLEKLRAGVDSEDGVVGASNGGSQVSGE